MAKNLLEVAGTFPLAGREYGLSYSPRNSLRRNYESLCDCGDCTSDNCDCSQGGDCVCTDCNECDND